MEQAGDNGPIVDEKNDEMMNLDDKEKKGALVELQPKTEMNLVRQMCVLMDILMEETKFIENMEDELLHKIFVFAAIWGLGGCLE